MSKIPNRKEIYAAYFKTVLSISKQTKVNTLASCLHKQADNRFVVTSTLRASLSDHTAS